MHMILEISMISMIRKERDMKKKQAGKTPKSRRPLYYVDNPNMLELKWLDDIQQKVTKPISVHGAAASIQKPVEGQAAVKQSRSIAIAHNGGNANPVETPAETIV